jgi:hypothetical protein
MGESASADYEAAKAYFAQLKKLTEEKGYKAKQVFTAYKTALFWKMPQCIYIAVEENG